MFSAPQNFSPDAGRALTAPSAASLETSQLVLERLNEIARVLEETEDFAQVVRLREMAEAMRFLARKAELARDIQNRVGDGGKNANAPSSRDANYVPRHQAVKSRLDAERKVGEITRDMEKNTGGRPTKNLYHDETGFDDTPPTYDEIGITRLQAHRWMTMAEDAPTRQVVAMAALPQDRYEEFVAETVEAGHELVNGVA